VSDVKVYTIEGDLEYIYSIMEALKNSYVSAVLTNEEKSVLIYNHQIEKIELKVHVDENKELPNDTRYY